MSEKNESRDWELTCDHCDGSGHIFVERQVAERKTDVQEFKEGCECCEGRGFTIAFEDMPGIAEYAKSCRAPSEHGDALDAARWRWLSAQFDNLTTSESVLFLEMLYLNPDKACSPLGATVDAALAAQVPQQGEA